MSLLRRLTGMVVLAGSLYACTTPAIEPADVVQPVVQAVSVHDPVPVVSVVSSTSPPRPYRYRSRRHLLPELDDLVVSSPQDIYRGDKLQTRHIIEATKETFRQASHINGVFGDSFRFVLDAYTAVEERVQHLQSFAKFRVSEEYFDSVINSLTSGEKLYTNAPVVVSIPRYSSDTTEFFGKFSGKPNLDDLRAHVGFRMPIRPNRPRRVRMELQGSIYSHLSPDVGRKTPHHGFSLFFSLEH